MPLDVARKTAPRIEARVHAQVCDSVLDGALAAYARLSDENRDLRLEVKALRQRVAARREAYRRRFVWAACFASVMTVVALAGWLR